MKYAKWMLTMTLMLMPGLAAAQLSTGNGLVAQVPFEFMAGNKFIPAGQCKIWSATHDGGGLPTLMVTGDKVHVLATAVLDETKKPAATYALIFKRYGSQYFLSGIKLADSRTIYRLPESKAEAEMRAQNARATEEVLLASALK
jgi:hypothetical protein